MSRKRLKGEGTVFDYRGKKRVQITLDTGERPHIDCEAEDAAAALHELRTKYGLIEYSGDMTFEEWAEEWLFTIKFNSCSPKTIQDYHSSFKNYIFTHKFARMKLSQIKRMDVNKLFSELLKEDVSVQMFRKLRTRLYSCFKDAEDYIVKNPMQNIEIPANARDNSRSYEKGTIDSEEEEEYNALTTKEQEALITNIKGLDKDIPFIEVVLNTLYIFALGTGLRLGELLAINYERDFQKDFTILKVNYNLQKLPVYDDRKISSYELKECVPKKKSIRSVTLPSSLTAYIKKYIIFLKKHHLEDPYFKNKGILFPNELGGWIERKRPNYRLDSLEKELGIYDVNLHGLRHTYATRLLENGENIQVISKLLGHRDVSITTEVYAHVLNTLKMKAAEKVDGILAL